jgi:hypothetical protein
VEQQVDVAKLVHDYMRGFAKSYQVPRHYNEEDELLEWCASIGREYRDWTYHKGHPKDPHCSLSIKDPKWCTVFELRWAHLIIGSIDRKP